MRISKLLASSFVALSLLFVSASASAGPPTDLVRAKQTQLFELIKQPRTPARQVQLKALFDEMLAYDVIGRAALERHWDALTADQKKRYLDVLTAIVANNYRRNLQRMQDYDIRYISEEAATGGGTWVHTEAHHKTDQDEVPIEVSFRIESVAGRLKVTDLAPEGASLQRTYKAQFNRIIKRDGFEGLMSKLEKKRAKQERNLD